MTRKLTCAEARELAQLHLDDALVEERLERLERHLETCSACREELEALRSLRVALRTMPPLELPDATLEQVFASTVDREPAARGLWARWRWAAIAAVILMVSLLVPWLDGIRHEEPGRPAAMSEAEARRAALEVRSALRIAGEAVRRGGERGLTTAIEDGIAPALGGESAQATQRVLAHELVPPVRHYSLDFWTRIPTIPEAAVDGS